MMVFRSIGWDEEAARDLAAVYPDPEVLSQMADAVARGDATVFRIIAPHGSVGHLVLGLEHDQHGDDMVIYALSGRGAGVVVAVDAFTRELAQTMGKDGVRGLTSRPGMAAHFERLGWRETATLYRVEV